MGWKNKVWMDREGRSYRCQISQFYRSFIPPLTQYHRMYACLFLSLQFTAAAAVSVITQSLSIYFICLQAFYCVWVNIVRVYKGLLLR